MKVWKYAIIAAGVLIVGLVAFVLRTYYVAGEFKDLEPHFAGSCRRVVGVLSSEDITIDQKTGLAFISSMERGPDLAAKTRRPGAVFAYDLNAANPRLRNLTEDLGFDFQPHGLGLYRHESGALSLFVVNHRFDGHYVEIFDYQDQRLIPRRSIKSEMMHSPNDVLPVGPEQFYVTNDHGARSALGRLVEDYLQLPWSNVLYFDGRGFRPAAGELAYANGINISPDGRRVYVAETLGRRVRVFGRDPRTNELSPLESIEVGTGVDNIEVDPAGNLWLGAHPKLLAFAAHAKDPAKLSPCQVLKISFEPGGGRRLEEIYLGGGQELSGSSVAAVYGDLLLIGAVVDHRFLVCQMR